MNHVTFHQAITKSFPVGPEALYRFIRPIGLELRRHINSNESDEEEIVGHFEGWHLMGDFALNKGIDLLDQAEAISEDLYAAAKAAQGLTRLLPWTSLNALYLSSAYLAPDVRGEDLTRQAIEGLITCCDPAHLDFVVTFPKVQEKSGQAKLEKHLLDLGFKKHPRAKGCLYANVEEMDP